MSDYNGTLHLRDAFQWSRAITAAFWENTGTKLDQGYMHVLLAGAMMAMHDSIFNNEITKERQKVEILKEALEYYGNKSNLVYIKNGIYQTGKIWIEKRFGVIEMEQGAAAREALEKLEEME